MAKECYLALCRPTEQTYHVEENVKEWKPLPEKEQFVPHGDTKTVSVGKYTITIGSSSHAEVLSKVEQVLRDNEAVFATSPKDMEGINLDVMVHKLSVFPESKPIRQKKRLMVVERQLAVKEQVEKLLEAKFIRKVSYPEWLANDVLLKKSIKEREKRT